MGVALLTFAAAAALVIMAPGPDTLLVTRNFFRGGPKAGLVTSAGTVTGLTLWSGAAALGLSALVAASQVGYDIVRVAGGCYLIWLGVQSLRSRGAASEVGMDPSGPRTQRLVRVYLNGVLSNLLNPKIGIFFIAFLPEFVPTGAPVSATAAAFGGLFAVETGLWLAALVWLLQRGAGWLSTDPVRRRIDRATGVLLIGLGLRVATEAR
jgi:threonine/homoserine/homoserine lactone efflux protein